MKKLGFLLALLCLVCTATFAQESGKKIKTVLNQTELESIELTDLPEKVKKIISLKYAKYTFSKALKGTVKGKLVYKIKLEKEEVYEIVLITAEGKIIESETNDKYQN